ncbi:hypothetical protein [Pontibacter akesuensis]|uniref:Uncharacterized protein n=1 Tax=Pontibacter akesuensis TaxID=388950 RepID=A0A1I7KQG2_9BACT|nr:hypothetical protein [Pontibacter akesuensis]GHA81382.1 hypothetical protein GCM10007389_39910 [Pontibacter akesuensis]SFU99675.1 hypothetical protein SAMN04487941_3987 [Pontibacter akesuensis]
MKRILFLSTLVVFAATMSGCDKCSGEDPRARVINNGTKEASVQIKTTGGNTENLNNVPAGTSSEHRGYAAGAVTYTITLDKAVYEESVDMRECYEYDIVIDANNNITTTSRDRND